MGRPAKAAPWVWDGHVMVVSSPLMRLTCRPACEEGLGACRGIGLAPATPSGTSSPHKAGAVGVAATLPADEAGSVDVRLRGPRRCAGVRGWAGDLSPSGRRWGRRAPHASWAGVGGDREPAAVLLARAGFAASTAAEGRSTGTLGYLRSEATGSGERGETVLNPVARMLGTVVAARATGTRRGKHGHHPIPVCDRGHGPRVVR